MWAGALALALHGRGCPRKLCIGHVMERLELAVVCESVPRRPVLVVVCDQGLAVGGKGCGHYGLTTHIQCKEVQVHVDVGASLDWGNKKLPAP